MYASAIFICLSLGFFGVSVSITTYKLMCRTRCSHKPQEALFYSLIEEIVPDMCKDKVLSVFQVVTPKFSASGEASK